MANAEKLWSKYISIRLQTEKLCNPLKTEDYIPQPIVDVSPPKWHLGHTTWFFETFLLKEFGKQYKVYHSNYNYIFNSYYETVGERVMRPNRGHLSRPTVEEVYDYRHHIDSAVKKFMENNKIDANIEGIIEIGLQHEQQHQELLLTDMKYILGMNPLFPSYNGSAEKNQENTPSKQMADTFTEVEEGMYGIGYDGDDFCFDNELGRHEVFLYAFKFRNKLVTNKEYLEFMDDKGYEDFRHWHSEGWDWVRQNNVRAPFYWYFKDGKWHYFTLNGLREVNPEEPVTHVNFYEASAFAAWKGMRLLTEFEWEVACGKVNHRIHENANFVEAGIYHPVAEHIIQMLGNVWEWTNSAYLPYPFYKRPGGAVGEYNGKFMVNQMVLRGGSCATPKNHIRSTYRNFFHPDKQWQFTGIRLGTFI